MAEQRTFASLTLTLTTPTAIGGGLRRTSRARAGASRMSAGAMKPEIASPRACFETSVFGVTRERIRQIEVEALRKLRHPSRSQKLRDYLE